MRARGFPLTFDERLFFFMVLIASVNGLILLPVLLSLFGDVAAGDGQTRISVAEKMLSGMQAEEAGTGGGIIVAESAAF